MGCTVYTLSVSVVQCVHCLCQWYSVYNVCVSGRVDYYHSYHPPNDINNVLIGSISMYVMFDLVGNEISTEVGQRSPPNQTREGTFVS